MIAVIGLGFVGLTTALVFAEKGFTVYAHDIDEQRMQSLDRAEVPFHEPHLKEALQAHLGRGFHVTRNLGEAIARSSIVFFCVGTPSGPDGFTDVGPLLAAVKSVASVLPEEGYRVLVVKSTVPPGATAQAVRPYLLELGLAPGGEHLGLANNPEFLREGCAWDDFMNADRVIIGQDDERAGLAVEELYRCFEVPVYRVSLNNAEFVKYLSNTLLATLISFSNEMAMLAHVVGDVDIPHSFRMLHKDKRWSGSPAPVTTYAYPGCGFGGYCLPKDTQAAAALIRRLCGASPVLDAVLEVNERIKRFLVEKVASQVRPEQTIGLLGLSFKPGSDDVRDTPVAAMVRLLLEKDYRRLVAYDPLAMENFRREYGFPIDYAASMEEVARRSDHVLLLTAWDEFIRNKSLLERNVVWDFRYSLGS